MSRSPSARGCELLLYVLLPLHNTLRNCVFAYLEILLFLFLILGSKISSVTAVQVYLHCAMLLSMYEYVRLGGWCSRGSRLLTFRYHC